MMETTVTNERGLIPRAMAGGVGLLRVVRDDAHCLQEVASHAHIPGDPQDGRNARIHQNLGDVPHQNRQPPSLGDEFHLSILEELSELDDLHQLFMIIPGVDSPGPCLR
jgi:hypothetical protein